MTCQCNSSHEIAKLDLYLSSGENLKFSASPGPVCWEVIKKPVDSDGWRATIYSARDTSGSCSRMGCWVLDDEGGKVTEVEIYLDGEWRQWAVNFTFNDVSPHNSVGFSSPNVSAGGGSGDSIRYRYLDGNCTVTDYFSRAFSLDVTQPHSEIEDVQFNVRANPVIQGTNTLKVWDHNEENGAERIILETELDDGVEIVYASVRCLNSEDDPGEEPEDPPPFEVNSPIIIDTVDVLSLPRHPIFSFPLGEPDNPGCCLCCDGVEEILVNYVKFGVVTEVKIELGASPFYSPSD